MPLTPYLILRTSQQLVVSTILTFTTLFVLGALRALVTRDRWWQTGLETLVLGTFVAGAAYVAGHLVAGAAQLP